MKTGTMVLLLAIGGLGYLGLSKVAQQRGLTAPGAEGMGVAATIEAMTAQAAAAAQAADPYLAGPAFPLNVPGAGAKFEQMLAAIPGEIAPGALVPGGLEFRAGGVLGPGGELITWEQLASPGFQAQLAAMGWL